MARKLEGEKYQKLNRLHRYVLVLLSFDRRDSVLSQASERICVWEEHRLCSQFYIDSWRRLIHSGLSSMEREVCGDAPQARALAQNSPFSFLLKEIE